MLQSALVIGGLTTIGVELVKILVDSGQFHTIRAVDKSLPDLTPISGNYREYFHRIEFKQVNLTRPEAAAAAFELPSGAQFDVVFNCLVQLKPDSSSEYYRLYMVQQSTNVAREAARRGVLMVAEGSAKDYQDKGHFEPCEESCPMEARTLTGTYRILMDKALQGTPNLRLVLVRFPMVYGPTESSLVTPYLLIAYLVHQSGVAIPVQMDGSMRRHTIHALDAARAMLHLANWYADNNQQGVQAFNVADEGDTRNEDYSRVFAAIYPHDYMYTAPPAVLPTLEEAEAIRELLNEQVLGSWMDVVHECNIAHTPLSPYIYQEQFTPHPVAADTTKFKATGFTFRYPRFERDSLYETVAEFTKQGIWPTATGSLPTGS